MSNANNTNNTSTIAPLSHFRKALTDVEDKLREYINILAVRKKKLSTLESILAHDVVSDIEGDYEKLIKVCDGCFGWRDICTDWKNAAYALKDAEQDAYYKQFQS